MIKAKLMTFEEAKKIGLTDDGHDHRGESVCGAMCTAKKEKKPGAKEIFMEKFYLKQNGKKELIFMHKDRMKDLKKKKGGFEKYMKQFDSINGVEATKYIKDNKLIIADQEIK